MNDGWIPALNSVNTAINNATNAIAVANTTRADRKFAREEAEKTRDWQEQIYQKYQSPQAQVNQLKAAGINPYLDGVETRSVGSGATASAPSSHVPDYGSIGNSIMDALNAKRMLSEIESIDENTRSTYLDNVKKLFENGNLQEVYEYQIAELKADLETKKLTNSEFEVRVKALNLAYQQAKEAADSGINPHVDAHNESIQRVEHLKQSISNMKVDNAVKSFALETSKLYDRAFLQLDYQARKKEVEEFLDTSEVRVSLYNAQKSFAKLANDAATRADALDAITNETELIIAERILDAAKDGSTAFDAVLLRLLSSDPVNTLSAIQNLIPNVQVTNKNYSNTNLRISN